MAKAILVCGRICCGKTTYAHQLRMKEKAVVLSVDEMMLSLLDEYLGNTHETYAKRTETYLLHKSLEILETGISVILDWGPWTVEGRKKLKSFYAEHDYECEIHALNVDAMEWESRIIKRNKDIDAGKYQAYHVDEGLRAKFESLYEEVSEQEADFWIESK